MHVAFRRRLIRRLPYIEAAFLAMAQLCIWLMPAYAEGPQQPWRGIVRAVQLATLSSDLVLPVILVGAREGGGFTAGQTLIEFNCRRQKFELQALAALVREAHIAVNTNEHLASRGAGNRNDVEVAKARHDKSSAEWAALNERLSGCLIVAPFNGVVVELAVNAHEIPQSNRPLMVVANTEQLEIEFIVPSRNLITLDVGAKINFAIDETASSHAARIVRRAGSVDPVSQTAKVYAVFDPPSVGVLPGMSGTVSDPLMRP